MVIGPVIGDFSNHLVWCTLYYVFISNAPHVLYGLRGLPSWAWQKCNRLLRDAHEARLRCPDDVSGDIGGCSARRALKPNFYWTTQTMVTAGILPFRENSHGRTGYQTRDLMISSQRLWPLDHEAGLYSIVRVWFSGVVTLPVLSFMEKWFCETWWDSLAVQV